MLKQPLSPQIEGALEALCVIYLPSLIWILHVFALWLFMLSRYKCWKYDYML